MGIPWLDRLFVLLDHVHSTLERFLCEIAVIIGSPEHGAEHRLALPGRCRLANDGRCLVMGDAIEPQAADLRQNIGFHYIVIALEGGWSPGLSSIAWRIPKEGPVVGRKGHRVAGEV